MHVMRGLVKKLLLVILSLTYMCLISNAQQRLKIDSVINAWYQRGQFNGAVLVVDEGREVYRKAIGYIDASKQVPLDTRYRFHIGSIAKEFDAVGIMLLKEQGKLQLNDPLSTFFPHLPNWAKRMTVKHLLQYSSGLPKVKYNTVHGDADNWKDLYALQQLKFDPGTSYEYNNNNTFLRRQIIEKITGLSFKDFVEQKLLKPIGITDAIVDPTDQTPLVAKSFNDTFVQDKLLAPISGWTALNLDDLFRWSEAINHFKIITAVSTKELMLPFQENAQTGLGGGAMEQSKIIRHVHDGSLLHYQALLYYDATNERTLVLLNSRRHNNIYELAEAIDRILEH